MPDQLPSCPECSSEHTYELGALLVCPMCAHEWSSDEAGAASDDDVEVAVSVTDAVGNVLADGDDVTIAKDLKVKGAGGGVVKVGTKVRGIRFFSGGADGHDIEAKVPGFGHMQLKSSVVKKIV